MFKLRIAVADLDTGRSVAGLIGEALAPEPLAVTLFEHDAPAYVVEAYYQANSDLELIGVALSSLGIAIADFSCEAVPDANWVALSQSALPPVTAGRFTVHGSHDRCRFALRRNAIEIDAGEAFGTGHNATTTLCLEAIDCLARRRRFARVIDLGCGTGVLAIAAARAFANARVLAIDNDPIATSVARRNVRLNRVGGRVRVLTATGFELADLRSAPAADLVLANILPRPLMALAPATRRNIARGGMAILSGLLAHQARQVGAVYVAAGFRLVRRCVSHGWAALLLQRR